MGLDDRARRSEDLERRAQRRQGVRGAHAIGKLELWRAQPLERVPRPRRRRHQTRAFVMGIVEERDQPVTRHGVRGFLHGLTREPESPSDLRNRRGRLLDGAQD